MYNIRKVKCNSEVLVISKNNRATKTILVEVQKDLFNSIFDKQKLDFDKFYQLQICTLRKSTMSEIIKIRKGYTKELVSLNFIIKKNDLSEGMRKFLKGKRKFITRLLGYSKQRIKTINRIANGKK